MDPGRREQRRGPTNGRHPEPFSPLPKETIVKMKKDDFAWWWNTAWKSVQWIAVNVTRQTTLDDLLCEAMLTSVAVDKVWDTLVSMGWVTPDGTINPAALRAFLSQHKNG